MNAKWYVLLVDRNATGNHWLVSAAGWNKQTRDLGQALSFPTKGECDEWVRKGLHPTGWTAYAMEAPAERAAGRPGKRRVVTPYGTIQVLDGQRTFFD